MKLAKILSAIVLISLISSFYLIHLGLDKTNLFIISCAICGTAYVTLLFIYSRKLMISNIENLKS